MAAGEQKRVTLEMDWASAPDATKDFSLVVWRTGDKPVIIVPEKPLKQSDWPREEKRTFDNNAASPSGADNCTENPVVSALEDFENKWPALVIPESDGSVCRWGPINWET